MNKFLGKFIFVLLLTSGIVVASAEPDLEEQEQVEQEEQEVLEQDITEQEDIAVDQDQVEQEQIESVLGDTQEIEQIESEEVTQDKKEKKSFFGNMFKKKKQTQEPKKSKKEKKKEAKKHKENREAKKEQSRLNKQARKQERAEHRTARRDSRRHEYDMVVKMARKKELAKRKQTLVMRHENEKLATRWTESHNAEVAHDYELGMYSDLYKQPAWDTPATYVPFKHLLNVGFEYKYATDAYGNSGSGGDLTKLVFGENPIYLKDLLLVSKLLQDPNVTSIANYEYLKDLAYKKIDLLGQSEDCIVNFDLSRYLWKRNIVCGVRIPFVYQKHTINTEEPTLTKDDRIDPYFQKMMAQYGSFENFVADIFRAKGMKDLGGSSSGIGDVELYSHINFESSRFESMIAGAKIIIPSASKRASDKLWAPELGNGGFLGVAFFGGLCLHKSKYLNPHMFVQATGFADAHVNRRVPKKMTITEIKGGVVTQEITFSDRVKTDPVSFVAGDYEEAPFKEIGDNILSVNMRKGIEFNARIGNMIEKFVYRRAFLDVFYDLYVKAHDTFSGFKTEEWNIDPYRLCSQAVAHKIGTEYSYQYDKASRLRAGIDYVFAGRNIAKTFGAHINMNYSF